MKLPVLMDANLLVLWITGLVSTNYIAKNKNLSSYCVEDFYILYKYLGENKEFYLIPHILAETSNLLNYVRNPERKILYQAFKIFIDQHRENYIESQRISSLKEFVRLGLNDCSMLMEQDVSQGKACFILTADHDCYQAALARKLKAVNFNHLRQGEQAFWED